MQTITLGCDFQWQVLLILIVSTLQRGATVIILAVLAAPVCSRGGTTQGRLLAPLRVDPLVPVSRAASRSFTSSNSEVVTMYSARAGKICAISCCDFSMRSGVCGCVENALASAPGFFFSCACSFSKKLMNALGSYPALYMYCIPR